MRKRTAVALVAAGLVAGLALGTLGIASAVSGSSATATATAAGPGGPGGGGPGFGRGGRGGGGGLANSVATLTGLSVQDVIAKRQAGTSYEAIAKTKGVTAEQVVARAMKEATVRFDAMVKGGRMTADQEKRALEDLKTRLASEVSSTAALPRRGMRGGGELASSVASLTGMSVGDVMTKRKAGTSFADIAKTRGVSTADVVAKALKDATANLKSRLETEVNATGQSGPGGALGGRGGFGGPPPMDGGAPMD